MRTSQKCLATIALCTMTLLAACGPEVKKSANNPGANPDPGLGRSLATDSVEAHYADTLGQPSDPIAD